MSTRACPNILVVTLFAALSYHNLSSAAGSNPRRSRLPANKNCHIRLTGIRSFWTCMLEFTSVFSEVTVAEDCSFLQRAAMLAWQALYWLRQFRLSVCLSVCPSVCPSAHAGIVSKRRHVARCSLHCQIAKCV